MNRTIMVIMVVLLLLCGGMAGFAGGQAEEKEIVAVVPYGAGGSTDTTSRALEPALIKLGIKIKFVNKPGANGTEGTYWVKTQPADGSTLIVATPENFQFIPAMEDTGYTWKDFDPVATWSSAAFAFVVAKDAPWGSFQDLVRDAKANPGKINMGSTGVKGEYEYYVRKVEKTSGAEFNYVGFDGGGDVTTALLGGHIDVGYISVAGVAKLVEAGDFKALAHTSVLDRLPVWPDIPSVRELGYNIFHASYYSLWAPKGAPLEKRQKLANAVQEAIKDPEVIQKNQAKGLILNYLGIEGTLDLVEQVATEIIPGYVEMME